MKNNYFINGWGILIPFLRIKMEVLSSNYKHWILFEQQSRALAAQQQGKRNKLKCKKKKSFYTWETIVAVGVVHMGTWKGNLCNIYKGILHSECICQAHIDVITFLGRRHSPTPHWQTVILDRAKSPPFFFPFFPVSLNKKQPILDGPCLRVPTSFDRKSNQPSHHILSMSVYEFLLL